MGEAPPDRISDLPNSIVFHILSFVPTKYVLQMSVLSRRWRYLWTSVPTLNFGDDLFQSHRVRIGKQFENKMFVDFVNKVLMLHNMSHIQRFRLDWYDSTMSHVNSWVTVAIEKNVQELDLHITEYQMKLPHCLFTCKSLVSLKLVVGASHLILPPSICFSRLRTLDLCSVIFSKNVLFQQLLSSCPVLENLILKGCRWWDPEVVEISPTPVRNLFIRSCFKTNSGMKISIPNLTSFQFIDYYAMNYSLENLSSLIDASIDAKIDESYRSVRYGEFFHAVSNLLRGVSNARTLTLSDTTLEQLSNAPNLLESLPTFRNLNNLILTSGSKKKDFLVVAYLLRSAPCLESLLIHIKPNIYTYNKIECQEYSELLCLECLVDHLKVVKIRCFGGTEDELEFVKLVLRSASNVERVIIIKEKDLQKQTEIYQKLLMFKRASASCIISMS